MRYTRIWSVIGCLLGFASCSSDPRTTLRVTVNFDDSFGLDQLRVLTVLKESSGDIAQGERTIPDKPKILESGVRVFLLVPDNWDGKRVEVQMVGLASGQEKAKGVTLGQVKRADVMDASVTLLAPCKDECEIGEMRCENEQFRQCQKDADGCSRFTAPQACPTEKPYCSFDTCVAQCKDECTVNGQRRCRDNGYQVCGQFDKDTCLDWGAVISCGKNEICQQSDGQCMLSCDGKPCACNLDETQKCDDIGECRNGVRKCINGVFGSCAWEKGPEQEICDGKDNDCNEVIDDQDKLSPVACEKNMGVCFGAVKTCGGVDGWRPCGTNTYETRAQINQSTYEVEETLCDGKDNDCDGQTDEPSKCCKPKCEGKACGAEDECGGKCTQGTCPGKQEVCENGGCVCKGDCSNTPCGEDDGCGKKCMSGICPTNKTCQEGNCVCSPGYHTCEGEECYSDSDPTHCGSSCTVCPSTLPNSHPVCLSGICNSECNDGYILCAGQCVKEDASTCGPTCEPCPGAPNGTAVCTKGVCGIACNAGFHTCTNQCVADNSPLTCGTSCSPCPLTQTLRKATCISGVCGTDCIDQCNSGCVDIFYDTAHCGTCTRSCATGEVCSAGNCLKTCAGGWTFKPAILTEVFQAGNFVVANFDSDKLSDVMVIQSGAFNCHLLRGKTDGSLNTPEKIMVNSYKAWLSTIVAADFNKDGKMDFATAGSGSSDNYQIDVMLGDGNGLFSGKSVTTIGGSIAAGDFNGDGLSDLATGLFPYYSLKESAVTVFYQNNSNSFGAGTTYPMTREKRSDPRILGVDVSLDKRTDLVIVDDYQIYVLLSNGSSMQWGSTVTVSGSEPRMVSGDFNKDGRPDLAILSQDPAKIDIYSGDGIGRFSKVKTLSLSSACNLVAADFNQDGDMDLVASGDNNGQVYLFLNKGNASFTTAIPFSSGGANPCNLGAGDVNGDGWMDLLVSHYGSSTPGSIAVLLGTCQ